MREHHHVRPSPTKKLDRPLHSSARCSDDQAAHVFGLYPESSEEKWSIGLDVPPGHDASKNVTETEEIQALRAKKQTLCRTAQIAMSTDARQPSMRKED